MPFLAAAVLAAALLGAAPAPHQDPAAARRAFAAAEAALEPHLDVFLDNDPRAPALLEQEHAAIRQWAADYLNQHPSASNAEIAAAVKGLVGGRLADSFRADVIRLNPDTALVSISVGQQGDLFILAKSAGRYRLAWDVEDAVHLPKASPAIMAWSPDRDRQDCRDHQPQSQWMTCGPVYPVEAGRLPRARSGGYFYVEAGYAQAMGATGGEQLSFWTWNGETAAPELVRTYTVMADQDPPQLKGDILHVGVKGEFQSLYACGACFGRRMDWRFRVTPTGIQDLGKTSLVPELDAVDDLYARLLTGKPTSGLVSPEVAKALAPDIQSMQALARRPPPVSPPMAGMIGGWNVIRVGSVRQLCLSLDEGGNHLFTLRPARGGFYVSAVKDLGPAECKGQS